MRRVSPRQPDLFAPPPVQDDLFAARAPAPPARPPIEELKEMLAMLRAAERLPWPGVTATIEQELRALHLGRAAGPDGPSLAEAVLEQTERLLSIADRENRG